MKEISLGAMDQFAQYGGLLGMVIYALIAETAGMLFFLVWFIKSDRKAKNDAQLISSQQYEKRLTEEKHLANAVSEIAISVSHLATFLRNIPCMENHKDVKEFDREFGRPLTPHLRRDETA